MKFLLFVALSLAVVLSVNAASLGRLARLQDRVLQPPGIPEAVQKNVLCQTCTAIVGTYNQYNIVANSAPPNQPVKVADVETACEAAVPQTQGPAQTQAIRQEWIKLCVSKFKTAIDPEIVSKYFKHDLCKKVENGATTLVTPCPAPAFCGFKGFCPVLPNFTITGPNPNTPVGGLIGVKGGVYTFTGAPSASPSAAAPPRPGK